VEQAMKRRILIIEDDADIAQLVEFHLNELDFLTELEHDGDAGLRRALHESFDLIVLDLMLPGREGLDICRQLRANGNRVPILMLTARSTEVDRVLGLEMGADDYLTKPFSVLEFCARVRALIRRMELSGGQPAANELIQVHGVSIDPERHEVAVEGRTVALTAKEFGLLFFLASHPGRVFTRGQLLEQVWGYGHDGYEHTVNSHINRLRSKIEPDPTHPRHILTVWSVGYKFRDRAALAS
jgi:DNA-binding response OmpR family regulator